MANMSYCRWENTSKDMQDCINSMEDMDDGFEFSSSHEEQGFHNALNAAVMMLEMATPEQLEAAGVDFSRICC